MIQNLIEYDVAFQFPNSTAKDKEWKSWIKTVHSNKGQLATLFVTIITFPFCLCFCLQQLLRVLVSRNEQQNGGINKENTEKWEFEYFSNKQDMNLTINLIINKFEDLYIYIWVKFAYWHVCLTYKNKLSVQGYIYQFTSWLLLNTSLSFVIYNNIFCLLFIGLVWGKLTIKIVKKKILNLMLVKNVFVNIYIFRYWFTSIQMN